jgi:serine/threonine protein phosphatase 1
MMKFWAHILRMIGGEPRGREFAGPHPDAPFLAVGDIHGRADLLARLMMRIETDHPEWPVVFLGDYIDRGADSRRVLDRLMAATLGPAPRAVCLMGNHELMLLDFLDDPLRHGPRWLRNGGDATARSFDVAVSRHTEDPDALYQARDALAAAMGRERAAWIRALPLVWRSGNVWAVHAGADPARSMEDQDAGTFLWGDPGFLRHPRADGQWIVHGHTIMKAPKIGEGRISIDTGAYATGILTAAVITSEGTGFLDAQIEDAGRP